MIEQQNSPDLAMSTGPRGLKSPLVRKSNVPYGAMKVGGSDKNPTYVDIKSVDDYNTLTIGDYTRNRDYAYDSNDTNEMGLQALQSGFGKSKLDKGITYLSDFNDLNEYRARMQPWYDQLANGTTKGIVLTGTTFANGTIGMIKGLYEMADGSGDGEGFVDNSVMRLMEAINNEAEANLANYYTRDERQMGFFEQMGNSMNFWADKFIKNLGFTVGAALSGKAWSSAFNLGNLMSKAGFGLSESTVGQQLWGSALSAVAEGSIEAFHAKKEYLSDISAQIDEQYSADIAAIHNNKNLSDEEKARLLAVIDKKKQIAMNAAEASTDKLVDYTLLANTLLLSATNMATLGHIYTRGFNTARNVADGIKRTGFDTFTKTGKYWRGFKASTAWMSEGFEEGAQYIISDAGKMTAKQAYDNKMNKLYHPEAVAESVSWFKNLYRAAGESVNDKQFWEEVGIGSLTGMLGIPGFRARQNNMGEKQSPIVMESGLFRELYDYFKEEKNIDEHVARLNAFSNSKAADLMRSHVRNITINRGKDAALLDGDEKTYKDYDGLELASNVLAFDNAGQLGALREIVEAKTKEDLTDDDIKDIINKSSKKVDDENNQTERVSPFVKPNGENMSNDEIRGVIKKNAKRYLGYIDTFVAEKNKIDRVTKGALSDGVLAMAAMHKADYYEALRRFKDVASEVSADLDKVLGLYSQNPSFVHSEIGEDSEEGKLLSAIANKHGNDTVVALSKLKSNVDRTVNMIGLGEHSKDDAAMALFNLELGDLESAYRSLKEKKDETGHSIEVERLMQGAIDLVRLKNTAIESNKAAEFISGNQNDVHGYYRELQKKYMDKYLESRTRAAIEALNRSNTVEDASDNEDKLNEDNGGEDIFLENQMKGKPVLKAANRIHRYIRRKMSEIAQRAKEISDEISEAETIYNDPNTNPNKKTAIEDKLMSLQENFYSLTGAYHALNAAENFITSLALSRDNDGNIDGGVVYSAAERQKFVDMLIDKAEDRLESIFGSNERSVIESIDPSEVIRKIAKNIEALSIKYNLDDTGTSQAMVDADIIVDAESKHGKIKLVSDEKYDELRNYNYEEEESVEDNDEDIQEDDNNDTSRPGFRFLDKMLRMLDRARGKLEGYQDKLRRKIANLRGEDYEDTEDEDEQQEQADSQQDSQNRKGHKQIAKYMKAYNDATDYTGRANAINGFNENVRKGAETTQEEAEFFKKAEEDLKNEGYYIEPIGGTKVNKVDKYTETSVVEDESLEDGESVYDFVNKPMIKRVDSGEVVQFPEARIAKGTKANDVTSLVLANIKAKYPDVSDAVLGKIKYVLDDMIKSNTAFGKVMAGASSDNNHKAGVLTSFIEGILSKNTSITMLDVSNLYVDALLSVANDRSETLMTSSNAKALYALIKTIKKNLFDFKMNIPLDIFVSLHDAVGDTTSGDITSRIIAAASATGRVSVAVTDDIDEETDEIDPSGQHVTVSPSGEIFVGKKPLSVINLSIISEKTVEELQKKLSNNEDIKTVQDEFDNLSKAYAIIRKIADSISSSNYTKGILSNENASKLNKAIGELITADTKIRSTLKNGNKNKEEEEKEKPKEEKKQDNSKPEYMNVQSTDEAVNLINNYINELQRTSDPIRRAFLESGVKYLDRYIKGYGIIDSTSTIDYVDERDENLSDEINQKIDHIKYNISIGSYGYAAQLLSRLLADIDRRNRGKFSYPITQSDHEFINDVKSKLEELGYTFYKGTEAGVLSTNKNKYIPFGRKKVSYRSYGYTGDAQETPYSDILESSHKNEDNYISTIKSFINDNKDSFSKQEKSMLDDILKFRKNPKEAAQLIDAFKSIYEERRDALIPIIDFVEYVSEELSQMGYETFNPMYANNNMRINGVKRFSSVSEDVEPGNPRQEVNTGTVTFNGQIVEPGSYVEVVSAYKDASHKEINDKLKELVSIAENSKTNDEFISAMEELTKFWHDNTGKFIEGNSIPVSLESRLNELGYEYTKDNNGFINGIRKADESSIIEEAVEIIPDNQIDRVDNSLDEADTEDKIEESEKNKSSWLNGITEFTMYKEGGTRIPIQSSAYYKGLKDNKQREWIGKVVERLNSENSKINIHNLKSSRNIPIRFIYDNSIDAIFVTDENGNYITALSNPNLFDSAKRHSGLQQFYEFAKNKYNEETSKNDSNIGSILDLNIEGAEISRIDGGRIIGTNDSYSAGSQSNIIYIGSNREWYVHGDSNSKSYLNQKAKEMTKNKMAPGIYLMSPSTAGKFTPVRAYTPMFDKDFTMPRGKINDLLNKAMSIISDAINESNSNDWSDISVRRSVNDSIILAKNILNKFLNFGESINISIASDKDGKQKAVVFINRISVVDGSKVKASNDNRTLASFDLTSSELSSIDSFMAKYNDVISKSRNISKSDMHMYIPRITMPMKIFSAGNIAIQTNKNKNASKESISIEDYIDAGLIKSNVDFSTKQSSSTSNHYIEITPVDSNGKAIKNDKTKSDRVDVRRANSDKYQIMGMDIYKDENGDTMFVSSKSEKVSYPSSQEVYSLIRTIYENIKNNPTSVEEHLYDNIRTVQYLDESSNVTYTFMAVSNGNSVSFYRLNNKSFNKPRELFLRVGGQSDLVLNSNLRKEYDRVYGTNTNNTAPSNTTTAQTDKKEEKPSSNNNKKNGGQNSESAKNSTNTAQTKTLHFIEGKLAEVRKNFPSNNGPTHSGKGASGMNKKFNRGGMSDEDIEKAVDNVTGSGSKIGINAFDEIISKMSLPKNVVKSAIESIGKIISSSKDFVNGSLDINSKEGLGTIGNIKDTLKRLNSASTDIGTMIDSAMRAGVHSAFLHNDKSRIADAVNEATKDFKMTDKARASVVTTVERIYDILVKEGLKAITNGTFMAYRNSNGNVFMGEADIIAVDNNGNISIIDLKTMFSNGTRAGKGSTDLNSSYSGQLNAYRALAKKIFNADNVETYVLGVNISYDGNGNFNSSSKPTGLTKITHDSEFNIDSIDSGNSNRQSQPKIESQQQSSHDNVSSTQNSDSDTQSSSTSSSRSVLDYSRDLTPGKAVNLDTGEYIDADNIDTSNPDSRFLYKNKNGRIYYTTGEESILFSESEYTNNPMVFGDTPQVKTSIAEGELSVENVLARPEITLDNSVGMDRALAWITEALPQLAMEGRIKVVDGLLNVASRGKNAWGAYTSRMIYLSSKNPRGTLYHEAMHAVIDMSLTDEQRMELFEEALKVYKGEDMDSIEERIANEFAEYKLTKDDTSLTSKILGFFKMILEHLGLFKKHGGYMMKFFNDVNTGVYADKSVTPKPSEFKNLPRATQDELAQYGITAVAYNSMTDNEKEYVRNCRGF